MLHKMGTVELVLHALRKCNSIEKYLANFWQFFTISLKKPTFGNLGHTLCQYCPDRCKGYKEEMSKSICWLGGYELVSWLGHYTFNICCNGSDISWSHVDHLLKQINWFNKLMS